MTISIICFGRDDDFHADYIQRTRACLLFNLLSIRRAGLIGKVKYLFVDYGSKVPLSSKLNVPKEYHESIDFLTVSPSEIEGKSIKNEFLAYGLILKNAVNFLESPFIFWGASDLIGQAADFSRLYEYCVSMDLSDNCPLLVIERVFLNRRFFNSERNFEEVDFYLRNAICEAQQISGSGGGGAYIGSNLHCLSLFGGLAHERLPPGRSEPDIELFIRSLDRSHPRNISKIAGARFFKFPYHRTGSRARIFSLQTKPWMIDVLGVKPATGCEEALGFLEKPQAYEGSEHDRRFFMKELPEFNHSFPLLCGIFRSWSSLHNIRDVFSILNRLDGDRCKCVILYGDFHYSVPLACASKLGFGMVYWIYGSKSKLSLPTFLNYARIDASNLTGFLETTAFHGIIKCAPIGSKIHLTIDEAKFNGDDKVTIIAHNNRRIYTSKVELQAVERPQALALYIGKLEVCDLLRSTKLSLKDLARVIYALLFNFFRRKLRIV